MARSQAPYIHVIQIGRAHVWTPGASSWAHKTNSSFLRDRMHSSKESWRTPTVWLGDTSSKSTLAVEVEAGFWWCHSSRCSLKVLPVTVLGMKHPPGNPIGHHREVYTSHHDVLLELSQLLFQCSPPQKWQWWLHGAKARGLTWGARALGVPSLAMACFIMSMRVVSSVGSVKTWSTKSRSEVKDMMICQSISK